MELLLPTGVILNSDNEMIIQQHLNHGAVEYIKKLETIQEEAVKNESETIQEEAVKPKRGRKSTKSQT